jgi:ABC-2 type transport system ATP-binding protein
VEDNSIEIKNVSVVLGKKFKALNDISAVLPKGKIIGFIGPSGAGKTTLIRSIVGRQKVTSGTITIFDIPAGSAQLRKEISYMTQETSVYSDLTAIENLRYFAVMVGIPKNQVKSEVERVISAVELTDHAHQLVSDLSGGQKQRVSLATSLIGNPKLLVLDEPTVGLDPLLREQLWRLFRQLASEGTTLIISSHVMDEAERCDELLLIRDGALLAMGSPKELCEQTHTSSVEKSFLVLVGENK